MGLEEASFRSLNLGTESDLQTLSCPGQGVRKRPLVGLLRSRIHVPLLRTSSAISKPWPISNAQSPTTVKKLSIHSYPLYHVCTPQYTQQLSSPVRSHS